MSILDTAAQNKSLGLDYGPTPARAASHTVHLAAGDPSLGGVEIDAAAGYVSQPLSNDAAGWPNAPVGGTLTSAEVTFGPSTAEWTAGGVAALATHWFLVDPDGNRWDSGPLDQEMDVRQAGMSFSITCTVAYANRDQE